MDLNFCIFAGKELGYRSLDFLIKSKNLPKLIIINDDDNGYDNPLHKSCLKLAKKYKIKSSKLKKYKNSNLKFFEDIDYIFCLGSTKIIPDLILKKVKIGAINIHPSLLPRYRGRYSTVKAIFNNDKFSGITIHWIDKKIDAGKIILKKKFPIKKSDTAKDLYKKFTQTGFLEFKKLFKKIKKNKPVYSYELKKSSTKYNEKTLPNNGIINWNWSGKKILNFIRSMTYEPFEPPKFHLGNKTYYVVEKSLLKKKSFHESPN